VKINTKEYITESANQTKKFGMMFANELRSEKIIALFGDLGSGKTTFTQGLLKGLGIEGPCTSPTFVVFKHYKSKLKVRNKLRITNHKLPSVYHIDAYRVKAEDILNLGWKEIIANERNIVIVEWADKIKKIIPKRAIWIGFEWVDKNRRKISISRKF
jgi:tRNA threonylcarbamoyladenosine biosynthesis protein TsaE